MGSTRSDDLEVGNAPVPLEFETGSVALLILGRSSRSFFLAVSIFGATVALLGLLVAVTESGEFEDDRVVDDPVDSRSSGHRVLEDPVPLGEDQVACDRPLMTHTSSQLLR